MPLNALHIPAQPRENEPASAARESAETLTLLAQRRSTKVAHLQAPAPSGADLEALIALAARAPDHGKLGPWRFVVIEGDGRARAGAALAGVTDEERRESARMLFSRAPLCVMVVASPKPSVKVPEWEQILSAGAVCYGLLIGAHAMGYAGCWLTEWPAFDARARAALGLAEHERIAGFVYLGSAPAPPLERGRPAIAERITRL